MAELEGCYNLGMRFANREKHAIAMTPALMRAVNQWLDGLIGIQEFIDLTKCTRTSAYSTIARACRAARLRDRVPARSHGDVPA
jgi:hypothetical protein